LATLAGVWVTWYLGKLTKQWKELGTRLNAVAFTAEYFRDIRAWASEAVDVLSEAIYAGMGGGTVTPESESLLRRSRCRLSALIDRGRFFLPNIRVDDHGANKPSAYQGYRHPALDPLMAAERILGGTLGRFESPQEALIAMRRNFVSAIQRILDPAFLNQRVKQLIEESYGHRADDPTLGGLVQDTIPPGVGALLSR